MDKPSLMFIDEFPVHLSTKELQQYKRLEQQYGQTEEGRQRRRSFLRQLLQKDKKKVGNR